MKGKKHIVVVGYAKDRVPMREVRYGFATRAEAEAFMLGSRVCFDKSNGECFGFRFE